MKISDVALFEVTGTWSGKEFPPGDRRLRTAGVPLATGGISELVKICALCSSFDVPVVAHGHSLLAGLHVTGSQSPAAVPMVEYLIRHPTRFGIEVSDSRKSEGVTMSTRSINSNDEECEKDLTALVPRSTPR